MEEEQQEGVERGEEGGAGDQRGLLMQGNEVQAVVCFWVWSWWDRNVVLVGPECGPGGTRMWSWWPL